MGEANNRGSKEQRVNGAVEHKEAINDAIENREHTKGLVWLVIESAKSVVQTDAGGAFVVGESGQMVYGPDDDTWQRLRPEDVPEWLKQDMLIKELMDGVQVCSHADAGGMWYRGVICAASEEEAIH